MKMSEVFTLPLCGSTLSYDVMYVQKPQGPTTAAAAAHAVNHHDALVEALSDLLGYEGFNAAGLANAPALLERIKS